MSVWVISVARLTIAYAFLQVYDCPVEGCEGVVRRLDRHLVSVHKMTRQSEEYRDHFRRATSSILKSPDMDSSPSISSDDCSDQDMIGSDGDEVDSQQPQEDEVYANPDEILKEVRSQPGVLFGAYIDDSILNSRQFICMLTNLEKALLVWRGGGVNLALVFECDVPTTDLV